MTSAAPAKLAPEARHSGLSSILRYRNRPLQRFADARACSDRASAFELFGIYHLILFDPELIEQVLVGDHASFAKDAFVRDLSAILGNGLLNSDGDLWRRQRKLAAPSLQRSEIAAYAEQMLECTAGFLRQVEHGQPFDMHAAMMHLTLDILARTLLGTEVSRVREVEAALDGVMREYTPLRIALRIGLPPWVMYFSRQRIARLRRALDSVVLELIESRKAEPGSGSDLLSRLLAANDADGGMSAEQLRDETMTMFLAGHETTALALTYAFRLLALHPEVAERAQREVRSVLAGRPPRSSDMAELPYTRAVLDESLRLFPPAWAMAREATRDLEIGEFQCSARDEVIVVPWVMHRDPRFFDEPETFRPGRWLGKRELPRCVYMPFGAGPRVCIGTHFAITEAMLVLISCLATGQFRLAQRPAPPPFSLTPAITLRPSDPVMMQFERC